MVTYRIVDTHLDLIAPQPIPEHLHKACILVVHPLILTRIHNLEAVAAAIKELLGIVLWSATEIDGKQLREGVDLLLEDILRVEALRRHIELHLISHNGDSHRVAVAAQHRASASIDRTLAEDAILDTLGVEIDLGADGDNPHQTHHDDESQKHKNRI